MSIDYQNLRCLSVSEQDAINAAIDREMMRDPHAVAPRDVSSKPPKTSCISLGCDGPKSTGEARMQFDKKPTNAVWP